MAKRKSFEDKNKFIHPTRKKIIDTVFGRDDNTQKTFGYEADEHKRKVGDVWTDTDGTTWEQKDGYKSTVTKLDDVREYLNKLTNCSSEDCQTKIYNRIDKKLIRKTGKCLDCLQKYETILKTDGTYPFYEDYKMTRNKLAYAKELKQRYESALNDVKDRIEFVNERGEIEVWKWEIDPETVRKDITKDITDVTDIIRRLMERKTALEEKLMELNHSELIVK
jgi:hypothetical protein